VTSGSTGTGVAPGSGDAGRGVWSGSVWGSTTAPGITSRIQPALIRSGW
jgi:hypothetical protein